MAETQTREALIEQVARASAANDAARAALKATKQAEARALREFTDAQHALWEHQEAEVKAAKAALPATVRIDDASPAIDAILAELDENG